MEHIEVLGERFDSTRVYFQGDRLDVPYSDYPAAWPGIFFRGASKNSIIQYAVIRNAYQGIIAEQGSVNGAQKCNSTNALSTIFTMLVFTQYKAICR
jgi:hypothetical protein